MRIKLHSLIAATALFVFVLTVVACNAVNTVTTTPGNVGAITVNAACTPTPSARRPTFTVAPNERSTPGAINTAIARYQATYPGDVIVPTRTIDLAPQIARADKETLVVRHSDCTYDYVLLSSSDVGSFQSNLPPGDTIVAEAPPESSMGKHPARPPTLIPGQVPGVPYGPNGTPLTPGVTPPSEAPPPPALQTAVVQTLGTRTAATSTPAATTKP